MWRRRRNAASLDCIENTVFDDIKVVPRLVCGLHAVGDPHTLFHCEVVELHSILDLCGQVTDLCIQIGDHLVARGNLKFKVRYAMRTLLLLWFSQYRFK